MAARFQSSRSVSGVPSSAAGSRRATTFSPRAMANCSPRSTAASRVAAFFWNSSTVAVLMLVNLGWFQGQINQDSSSPPRLLRQGTVKTLAQVAGVGVGEVQNARGCVRGQQGNPLCQ